ARAVLSDPQGEAWNRHPGTIELKTHLSLFCGRGIRRRCGRLGGGLGGGKGNSGTQNQHASEHNAGSSPHRRAPWSSRVCAVWMWQIAMANASAASGESKAFSFSSRRLTMN